MTDASAIKAGRLAGGVQQEQTIVYCTENVLYVSPTPPRNCQKTSILPLQCVCTREEKVMANVIVLRLLCRIGLSFSENRHVLEISAYGSYYVLENFLPEAEHRPISVQYPNMAFSRLALFFFFYLRSNQSIHAITGYSLYTLHFLVTFLFYTCVITKQA